VQPPNCRLCPGLGGFNPHPSRRTGATLGVHCGSICRRSSFNPHPSRRTGATGLRRQRLRGIAFQSSPVPKDGCNIGDGYFHCTSSLFQSSPVPKDGCNRPRLVLER